MPKGGINMNGDEGIRDWFKNHFSPVHNMEGDSPSWIDSFCRSDFELWFISRHRGVFNII